MPAKLIQSKEKTKFIVVCWDKIANFVGSNEEVMD